MRLSQLKQLFVEDAAVATLERALIDKSINFPVSFKLKAKKTFFTKERALTFAFGCRVLESPVSVECLLCPAGT